MDFIEVVSPQVALPVIGVLVCAALVFAFGFKSPGQPPSFDVFEEDSKKKKQRKTKKSQSNGHAVSESPVTAVHVNKKLQASPRTGTKQAIKQQSPKPKQPSSTEQAPKPKQTSHPANVDQSFKPKQTNQAAHSEQTKKPKRAVKEEKAIVHEVDEGGDGWHTISKKDRGKKKEKVDSLTEDRPVEQAPSKENRQPSPALTQEEKGKKKKEKKAKKAKSDTEASDPDVGQEAVVAMEIQIVPPMTDNAVNETENQSKKKSKAKKEKKSPSPTRVEMKIEPVVEVVSKVTQQPVATPVAPASQGETTTPKETDSKDVKSPKKKQKKDKSKEQSKEATVQVVPASKSPKQEHTSLSKPASTQQDSTAPAASPKKSKPKEKKVEEVKKTEVVPDTQKPSVAKEEATPAPQAATPTFDEMGGTSESWMEAKPKSKKKKARREN